METRKSNNRFIGLIVFLFTLLILGAISYTIGLGDIVRNWVSANRPTPTAQTTTSALSPTDTPIPPPTPTVSLTPVSPTLTTATTAVPTAAATVTPSKKSELIKISAAGGPYNPCTLVSNEPTATTYIVQPGDTLSKIAADEYGSGAAKFYLAIFEATNQLAQTDATFATIERIDQIFSGQKLSLPPLAAADDIQERKTDRLAPFEPGSAGRSSGIRVVGSSTVFPLTARAAQCFVEAGFKGFINISSDGSLGGLDLLCTGEGDLLDASIEYTQADLPSGCIYTLDDLTKIQVGYDAVVVAISKKNPRFAGSEELDSLDVSALLESMADWGEAGVDGGAINRYFPGEGSGTLRFASQNLTGNTSALAQAPNIQDECPFALPADIPPFNREVDLTLAHCLALDPNGIGLFPYAASQALPDDLILLPIDGRSPLPEGTEADAIFRYPLFREIYIYLPNQKIAEIEYLSGFVNNYLNQVNDLIVAQNLFPLSTDDIQRVIDDYCALDGSICK